jgi:hypothetical protein
MNGFKRVAAVVAGAASIVLLAVPAATASTARPATPAAPAVSVFLLCDEASPALCLQNNGTSGSLIANDTKNSGTPLQRYFVTEEGVTSSTYPFDSSALNVPIDNGRPVFQLKDETTPGGATNNLCINVNGLEINLGACTTGSESLWVASGSGRMLSVGGSNEEDDYVFAKANDGNGGNPALVDGNHNGCPNACWSI